MNLSLGQNVNYINFIENHYVFPSMPVFLYICEYLNITPKEFFDVETKSPNDINELTSEIRSLDSNSIKHLTEFIREIKNNVKFSRQFFISNRIKVLHLALFVLYLLLWTKNSN